ADGADSRRAVGEGNEPDPAVLEPEDRDVAFELARQPLCAGEVAVERRAVVPPVILLSAPLVREQGVAPRGVDDEAGAPSAARAAPELDLDRRAVVVEGDLANALAFEGAGPLRLRVAKKNLVELGTPHLPGVRHRLVPGFDELDQLAGIVIRRDELDAVFLHADRLHAVAHAE